GRALAGGDEQVQVVLPPRPDRRVLGPRLEVVDEDEGRDAVVLAETRLEVPPAELVGGEHLEATRRLAGEDGEVALGPPLLVLQAHPHRRAGGGRTAPAREPPGRALGLGDAR